MPGLIVDRYNDILSMQILTQAMDAEAVRAVFTSELTQRLHPASIVERVEPRVRQLKDLPPRPSGLMQGEKTSTIFAMNGVQFYFDALEGQKTGAFLKRPARELRSRGPIRARRSPRRLLLPGRLCPSSCSALLTRRRRRQLPPRARSRRPECRTERPRNRVDRSQRLRCAQGLLGVRTAL